MTPLLDATGRQLIAAGVSEQGLLGWAGTRRLSMLPMRMSRTLARPAGPAAAGLALLVGGAELPIDAVKRLPLDALVDHGLVERDGDRVRAAVAILPVEAGLLVCDRLDAPDHEHRVCWPDDSSYHLASAIPPGRRALWIDLGTGSAFAPLVRPELAHAIVGIDVNPHAIRYARLGAALSGRDRYHALAHDIGECPQRDAQLITCNAPIIDDDDAAVWRRTDRAFFDRLWPSARACLEPGGLIVVHATLDALPAELPGEVVIVVYTPPGERGFAVQWWTPDAPTRRVVGRRMLTTTRPHLEPRDRVDALAGALPSLDHWRTADQ